jgi:predicted permease
MGMTHGLSWWRRLVKRGEMERRLDAELRLHFDGLVADNLRAGMSEREARRNARLEFGGLEQVKEECRDARGTRWLEETIRDLGFAGRSLRKSPVFATTAILILALGIGGNTAMFTVVRTVLLKPLGYADPDGLFRVSIDDPIQNNRDIGFSWFHREVIKDAKSFDGLGTFFIATENMTLSVNGEPEPLKGARISANLLPILGVQPILGRGFRPEEDAAGGPAVAMISASLWRRRFDGDPNVIGRSMTLNATPCTIAGVLPDGFQFPAPSVDVWVPRPWEFSAIPRAVQPRTNVLIGLARLKSHVTMQESRNELTVLHRQYMSIHPELGDARQGSSMRIVPLKEQMVANVRSMLWILFGAAGFIQLIACANLASLLLARATARSREFAIRAAMGASRDRLIRHFLAESLVLGTIGA